VEPIIEYQGIAARLYFHIRLFFRGFFHKNGLTKTAIEKRLILIKNKTMSI
jgi:hypothetical protein